MLRLIKRGKAQSCNQSPGLFSVNIFQSDQDSANQTLKRIPSLATSEPCAVLCQDLYVFQKFVGASLTPGRTVEQELQAMALKVSCRGLCPHLAHLSQVKLSSRNSDHHFLSSCGNSFIDTSLTLVIQQYNNIYNI